MSMENPLLSAARESLAHPLDFAQFLAKLSPKDRASAERRVSALEAVPNPDGALLWRRLACSLMTLAPHAAKLVGKQTLQIYVADGRYRMQVFALEDLQDGNFTIYCPDVLDEAVKAGLLSPAAYAEPHMYLIEPARQSLRVETLDGASASPAVHFKDMTGWNRKALRITLLPSPSAEQVQAAELLCAIAARHFVPAAAPASGGSIKK
jgi:hypothetical protein